MANELDITVLGGLPVTVEYCIQGADRDVGIMSAYVEEWYVVAINGRKCKKPPQWLYDRIEKCKGEEERIAELCAVHYDESEPDFEEPDDYYA